MPDIPPFWRNLEKLRFFFVKRGAASAYGAKAKPGDTYSLPFGNDDAK